MKVHKRFFIILVTLLSFIAPFTTNLIAQTTDSDVTVEAFEEATDESDDKDGMDIDIEINTTDVVEVKEEVGPWLSIGGPIGLGILFVVFIYIGVYFIPYRYNENPFNLHKYPAGVKRGLAICLAVYSFAFVLGALDIYYQVKLAGSAKEYFDQIGDGKMIGFTHAHLFGITTSFLVIGIPFSLQFNHLYVYQWIFPLGVGAALIDIMSWWGIKYIHSNFEIVSAIAGVVFSVCYLYMLAGLLRVLLFPKVVWFTDKDQNTRIERIEREKQKYKDMMKKRDLKDTSDFKADKFH